MLKSGSRRPIGFDTGFARSPKILNEQDLQVYQE
jgi:hypothetical protein